MTNKEVHRMKMLSKLIKREAPHARIERAMRAYTREEEKRGKKPE